MQDLCVLMPHAGQRKDDRGMDVVPASTPRIWHVHMKRFSAGGSHLCVSAALSFALPTSEKVGDSASSGSKLVVPDSLFGQILPHFLELITCHFLQMTNKKSRELKNNVYLLCKWW